jgi:glycosyltransferase involved in cell wall biosynthesis
MIKVAIDSGPIKSGDAVRGIGVHAVNLVKHLRKIKELNIDVLDFSKADLSGYDIAHYQKFHPYFFSLRPVKKTKEILTIHDLIYLIYPRHYPSGIRGRLRFLWQKRLIKRVDAVITISETSKKDIVRFLGIPAEKIDVIHLAPREIFKPTADTSLLYSIEVKYRLPKKFGLYVGDVNYNKNILGLIKAFALLKRSGSDNKDLKLVLVGKAFQDKSLPEVSSIHRCIDDKGLKNDIKILGYVPDEDLVAIYNLATVYCQPSFYEGFGLPVLEAFAAGCPVVAARTQALVEIAEPAAVFADPKDPKDIAEKISAVLADATFRNQLVETGRVVVKKYSWDKVARETRNVYKKVLK